MMIKQSNITKLFAAFSVLAGVTFLLINMVTNNVVNGISVNEGATEAKPINGFSLVNHNDNKITTDTFRARWTFVFFGFTNCPDICPATLSQLVQLNNLISQQPSMAGKFHTLFVSVDPDRDSTEYIKEYVKYFDPGFVGATGEMNNIVAFEKQFDAFHVIDDKRHENYSVGHTSSVFLVNPDARYSAKFAPPMDVSAVMQKLDKFVKEFSKG